MSYNYRVLNDNPRHFYALAGGSYLDLTARSNGEVLGSPKEAPPLVVGGGNALVFTGNDNFKFATSIFQEEDVIRPFSLEAWFKPVEVTQEKGIVGHLSTLDGLTFDGEKISFTTLHGTAGAARASWFPPTTFTSFHVVGVHSGEKNELYVNGVRVATVNLTVEQLAAPYEIVAGPGYLYSGHHPGTIIVDSVAVYAHALTSRQAKLHFLWGRDVPDFRNVIDREGGVYWDFTDQTAQIVYDSAFSSTLDWVQGQNASVDIENDTLSPIISDGLTLAGTWVNGFILGAISDNFDGSKIWWDSDGSVTVETSLNDGVNWSVAENGREIPGVSEKFASGNQSLSFRVTFPAGEPEDTITRMRSLHIRLYGDRDVSPNVSERQAEFTGKVVLAQEVHQPIEQNDFMGAHLYSGYSTILAGPEVRTIEMWVNIDRIPATTGYIYDTRTGAESWLYWNGVAWAGAPGTIYVVNGVETLPANMLLTPGQWNHITAILPAATTGTITLGARYSLDERLPAKFGFLASYSTARTVAEVTEQYNAYMGIPSITVTELTGMVVTDAAIPTKLYSHSWSTVGSG